MKKEGFTLIELLVVVLIIGILAAVALPQYRVAVGKARVARALPFLRSIVEPKERYYMANGSYTPNLDMLDISVSYTSVSPAETAESSWCYYGVSVRGHICITANNPNVFWASDTEVTIDVGRNFMLCYGANNIGDRICRSLGPKTDSVSVKGWPYYKMQF